MTQPPPSDGGFGGVLVIAVLALIALFSLAIADAANVLLARSRAQTAADAAALAAATAQWPFLGAGVEPEAAARDAAERNGAHLESCECELRAPPAVVTVRISTRIRMIGAAPAHVTATAEAAVDPARLFDEPTQTQAIDAGRAGLQ